MSYTHIIVELRDGLGSIILNRPDKRDALSLELMAELLEQDQIAAFLEKRQPVFKRS
jgi:hypothetical protein